MAWAGGTYTKGNASTGGWAGDESLGIGIESGRHDTQDNDFATGINNCLTKDGQNSATANLPMGGFKHTNVANATADNEYTTLGQIKAGVTIQAAGVNGPSLRVENYTNGSVTPQIYLFKSRGGTVGANAIVQSNYALGTIVWWGANGTGYNAAAGITAEVDGTPGASNDMPGRLIFYTTADNAGSPTERMRITSAGRIGINNTTPSGTFAVNNSESNAINAAIFQSTLAGDVGTAAVVVVKSDNNTTTSQSLIQFLVNGGASGSGQINGNGPNQAAFGSYSDVRLKENIDDLPPQLDKILALRPVEFDYKDGSGHQTGFIAQEVQEIYPDLIGTGENDMLTLSGLGKQEARLIKAIQELAARVEALEAAQP
jgi:hypothetical protein